MTNAFVVTKSIDYTSDGKTIERFFIDNKGNTVIGMLKREEMIILMDLIKNSIKINEEDDHE